MTSLVSCNFQMSVFVWTVSAQSSSLLSLPIIISKILTPVMHSPFCDYHCSDEEKHMECEVDPQMTITAVTNAKW